MNNKYDSCPHCRNSFNKPVNDIFICPWCFNIIEPKEEKDVTAIVKELLTDAVNADQLRKENKKLKDALREIYNIVDRLK